MSTLYRVGSPAAATVPTTPRVTAARMAGASVKRPARATRPTTTVAALQDRALSDVVLSRDDPGRTDDLSKTGSLLSAGGQRRVLGEQHRGGSDDHRHLGTCHGRSRGRRRRDRAVGIRLGLYVRVSRVSVGASRVVGPARIRVAVAYLVTGARYCRGATTPVRPRVTVLRNTAPGVAGPSGSDEQSRCAGDWRCFPESEAADRGS